MADISEPSDQNLNLQIKVSKLLSLGFAFSLVWLAGIGSLIALICGLKALRMIKQADDQISGKRLAVWCIVAGLVGLVVLPYLVISRLRDR